MFISFENETIWPILPVSGVYILDNQYWNKNLDSDIIIDITKSSCRNNNIVLEKLQYLINQIPNYR